MTIAGSICAFEKLGGSLASDCENVEKQEVSTGRRGLPERISNTDLAFPWLGERAVVVSRSSECWVLMCTAAGVDVGEVFCTESGDHLTTTSEGILQYKLDDYFIWSFAIQRI